MFTDPPLSVRGGGLGEPLALAPLGWLLGLSAGLFAGLFQGLYTSEPYDKTRKLATVELYIKDNYPSIIVSLIFIMISVRPDIALAVGRLARHMHNLGARTSAQKGGSP